MQADKRTSKNGYIGDERKEERENKKPAKAGGCSETVSNWRLDLFEKLLFVDIRPNVAYLFCPAADWLLKGFWRPELNIY